MVPGDDEKTIHVEENFVLPAVSDLDIPVCDQNPSDTVNELACFQCRFKLAIMARYNPAATKKVLCHNCYETVNDMGDQYERHLLLNELERQVFQNIINMLKGKDHRIKDTPPPNVTALPEVQAPVFTDTEIKEGLKLMLQKDSSSVKCENDRGIKTVKEKKDRLNDKSWKKYYWSTTVDQIREIITDEAINDVGLCKKPAVRSFREKVERVMQIMASHPDNASITQFESGRGVLMLFGGVGTHTHLHLDISGALTYQFTVSSHIYMTRT